MKPIRVQLRRVKGWKMPPNTVNVARPTKFGNPFRIGENLYPRTAQEAVDAFRFWLPMQKRLMDCIRHELAGKNLACFCPIIGNNFNYCPCHADVLLSVANDIEMEDIICENIEANKRWEGAHR